MDKAKKLIDKAINLSKFLQTTKYKDGIFIEEIEKETNVRIIFNALMKIIKNASSKTNPEMNEHHYQAIIGVNWNQIIESEGILESEKITIPEDINLNAFRELRDYIWNDLNDTNLVNEAKRYLNENKNKLNNLYKNVLKFIFDEKENNSSSTLKNGGKSRKVRRKKTNKKKIKGNKKRKTRARTRRKH